MLVTLVKSDPRGREKPCLRCGLSLRKLFDATHCPQCGLSVWLSLNDNQTLDWSNPRWLGRLSWGVGIMAVGQVFALAAFMLLVLPLRSAGGRYPWVAIVGGAYLILYHLGLLLASMHEGRYPDRLKVYRNGNRIIAGIAILFGVLLTARGMTCLSGGWPVPRPTEPAIAHPTTLPEDGAAEELAEMGSPFAFFGDLWLFATELVLAASAISTFAYLRKLAQRVPNSTVARICGYILLAPVVSFLKTFPFFGYFLIFQLLWLTHYLPAIYYPLTGGLLVWFAVAFRRASSNAAEGWATETKLTGGASRV